MNFPKFRYINLGVSKGTMTICTSIPPLLPFLLFWKTKARQYYSVLFRWHTFMNSLKSYGIPNEARQYEFLDQGLQTIGYRLNPAQYLFQQI
jgi:hypothetical protein